MNHCSKELCVDLVRFFISPLKYVTTTIVLTVNLTCDLTVYIRRGKPKTGVYMWLIFHNEIYMTTAWKPSAVRKEKGKERVKGSTRLQPCQSRADFRLFLLLFCFFLAMQKLQSCGLTWLRTCRESEKMLQWKRAGCQSEKRRKRSKMCLKLCGFPFVVL